MVLLHWPWYPYPILPPTLTIVPPPLAIVPPTRMTSDTTTYVLGWDYKSNYNYDLTWMNVNLTLRRTWMRLSTFSCTICGGSFFGPMILIISCRKSFCTMCRWNLRPQFLTHVSRTCVNNTLTCTQGNTLISS